VCDRFAARIIVDSGKEAVAFCCSSFGRLGWRQILRIGTPDTLNERTENHFERNFGFEVGKGEVLGREMDAEADG
jgi:hypothetical protein